MLTVYYEDGARKHREFTYRRNESLETYVGYYEDGVTKKLKESYYKTGERKSKIHYGNDGKAYLVGR